MKLSKALSRRKFIQVCGYSVGGIALGACSEQAPEHRYNDADIALLAKQQASELAASGTGKLGVHRYQGYRGLAELPWFDLDKNGELIVVDDSLPEAIDMHCHLGMSVLFEPTLDLLKAAPRTKHLLDCDGTTLGCDLDLDIYANGNFSEQSLKILRAEIRAQGLWGSKFAATQTIPNLISEMDAMRVRKAYLLPIKLGLWFGDELTEKWREAVSRADMTDRLVAGCSIHPRDTDWERELQRHAQAGAKIIKLHPTVQRFYPDDQSMMPIYETVQHLGMSVFFHGGRAGIEPDSSHPFAMPRHYQAALANFPNLKFILGHAGARDHQAMLTLAMANKNAWLGIHGQSVQNLHNMIEKADGNKLLFGTDWPFYHIGMSLAKVLITTQDTKSTALRAAILRDNALSFLSD